jgi:opacity protein-like surface antigen
MKKIIFSTVALLLLGSSSFAGGDINNVDVPTKEPVSEIDSSAFYVGLGYSYLWSNRTATINLPSSPNYGIIARDMDSTAHNLLLQIGYQYNRYLSVEGRYTVSVTDHTLTDNLKNGYKEDVDIDISNLAIYLKPMYPIGDVSVYALLGYGKTSRDHNVAHHTWEGNSFQWGAGVQYTITDNFILFADFTEWYNKNNEQNPLVPRLIDTDFTTLNIGLSYKF